MYLRRAQVRRVDQVAIERFGMSGLVLMENAGRGCTDVLCELGIDGPVVICCGKGNNGGDGLVIARQLDIRGWQPRVLLACEPGALRGDAAANYAILRRTSVPIVEVGTDCDTTMITRELQPAAWIVDALLGTGAKGEPRGPYAELIRLANGSNARKLAVDLPSGLDCDSGLAAEVTFRADHTCTLVAPKFGFQSESAPAYLGKVHVLDIGAPPEVLEEALKSPGAAF